MFGKVSNLREIINMFCMLSTDYYFQNFRGTKMLIILRIILNVNKNFWSISDLFKRKTNKQKKVELMN